MRGGWRRSRFDDIGARVGIWNDRPVSPPRTTVSWWTCRNVGNQLQRIESVRETLSLLRLIAEVVDVQLLRSEYFCGKACSNRKRFMSIASMSSVSKVGRA